MTYSAAVFEPGDTLEAAQVRKYETLCRMVDLRPSDHLLEIGTGWGGFAMHAASTRGCRVTTATISAEQAALARRRIAAAGLADRVEVILRDYRAIDGRYSKIVSIEMLEAVGEEYWPVFFATCDRLLEPGGAMGLQTITMPHRRYLASRHAYSWIHKYIFPGGLIPSREAIDRSLRDASTLGVTARRRDRPPLRDDAAALAHALHRAARARARARLRPHVRAYVGVLSGLLRGRVRHRRDRRRPAAPGPAVRLRVGAGVRWDRPAPRAAIGAARRGA